jgi:two-component system nitrogen regulation sensor histidine kinase NtrY
VVLLGISCLFYLAVLFSRFNKNITVNPFRNYLFIFWIIAISALTGSLAIYQHYLRQLLNYKQKFANDLLVDRDIQGEYLLNDISRQIQNDKFIRDRITDPLTNKDLIQRKIVKYYLRDYFDRYESNIKLFNHDDNSTKIAGSYNSLHDYEQIYLKKAQPTDHPGLYLIKEGLQPYSRKYIKLFRVVGEDGNSTTVSLELTLKKLMPYSVIPELLVDQRYFQPLANRGFSYAIYNHKVLQYNEGDFEYVHSINRRTLRNQSLYLTGIRLAGFHHFGVMSNKGKTIIVSSAQYSLLDVASNFSFLFLLHTLVFLAYMLSFYLCKEA